MKKIILTIATIGLLFTSCTKEDDLQPVSPTNVVMEAWIMSVDKGQIVFMDGSQGQGEYRLVTYTVRTDWNEDSSHNFLVDGGHMYYLNGTTYDSDGVKLQSQGLLLSFNKSQIIN